MALILALACVFQPILAFVALAFMALLFLQKVGNRRIGAIVQRGPAGRLSSLSMASRVERAALRELWP